MVVIYAYRRPEYLRTVIRALRVAAETSGHRVALTVSLDGLHTETAAAAEREADWCALRIIVHPVSSSLRDSSLDRRATTHTLSLLRLKEHWWWMMDHVLHTPGALPRNYSRGVLFLEEDLKVSPDALHCLDALEAEAEARQWEDMWAVTLSMWGMSVNSGEMASPESVMMLQWGHNSHAYSMPAHVWQRIRPARRVFFDFREGWDWSFFHLQQKALAPRKFLVPALSRLRNIGRIGLTQSGADYDRSGLANTAVSGPEHVAIREWRVIDRAARGGAPNDRECKPCINCPPCESVPSAPASPTTTRRGTSA